MKHITLSAFSALLVNISGATEIEILTRTNARARKNPFGKILKESRVTGIVGRPYQRAVNVALVKSIKLPTFKAAPRAWGKHIAPSVIEHKGKQYLQIEVKRSPFPRFVTLETLRGALVLRELFKEEVSRFLPARYFSERQAAKGVKDSKQVVSVTYALANIVEAVIGGEHYAIVEG